MKHPCLEPGCSALVTGSEPRCPAHYRKAQRIRNQAPERQKYRGAWSAISRGARQAQGYCTNCGATQDLTLDHTTMLVFCRVCHRPDSQGGARMDGAQGGGGRGSRAKGGAAYVPAPTAAHTLGSRYSGER